MSTVEVMMKELSRRHNNNVDELSAWAIGYIGSLEREIDCARQALGAERKEMTLIENLRIFADNQDCT